MTTWAPLHELRDRLAATSRTAPPEHAGGQNSGVGGHVYRVRWSERDGAHVATCSAYPSVSHLAPTRAEALAGIRDLVAVMEMDL